MEVATAVRRVQQMGVDFDASTLRGWELGWTGAPDPIRLLALARVYGVSVDEVISALRDSRGASGRTLKIPPDLVSQEPRETTVAGFKAVPLLARPIAAGQPLVVEPEPDRDQSLAFREDVTKKFSRPMCLRVGKREESMYPTIMPGDVVMIDQREERRAAPIAGNIYAINFAPLTGHEGGALKRIERDGRYLIVSSENPDKSNDAYRTKAFDVEDMNLLDVIKGEVVWFGRYIGRR